MTTVSELREQLLEQFRTLTWALKVNTMVTGAGLLFVGSSVLMLAWITSNNHRDEMAAIRGLNQQQTNNVNISREPSTNDLVHARLQQKGLISNKEH